LWNCGVWSPEDDSSQFGEDGQPVWLKRIGPQRMWLKRKYSLTSTQEALLDKFAGSFALLTDGINDNLMSICNAMEDCFCECASLSYGR
jgi:hypothetical protein